MVFTCTSNTGYIRWTDNDGTGAVEYSRSQQIQKQQKQLGIFKLALTSVNGMMVVSTATVDNVTYSQSSTNIYCTGKPLVYNDTDTLTVRGNMI